MTLVALKCPNCGGTLDLDNSREFAFCQYCGTKIMIQEEMVKQKVVLDESKKIAGWLDSAKLFLEKGMLNECYDYAKKATDADPTNTIGWYYRAESAPSRDEILVATSRCMDLLPEGDPLATRLEELKTNAANTFALTIAKQINATTAKIFLDDELIIFDETNSKKTNVLKGSHTVRIKLSGYNKAYTVDVYTDKTVLLTQTGFGIDLSEQSTSSRAKISDQKITVVADSALDAEITVTVVVTNDSIKLQPGESGDLNISGSSGAVIVNYKGQNGRSNVDFDGHPTYIAKKPKGLFLGKRCSLYRV